MGSFSTYWTWNDGLNIAYSVDTRLTKGLVEIRRNSIVLHGGTFDNVLLPEKIAKKHSGTSEAINAGNEMGSFSHISVNATGSCQF